jgi:hypothetical protein
MPRDQVALLWLTRAQHAIDAFVDEIDETIRLAHVQFEVRVVGKETG